MKIPGILVNMVDRFFRSKINEVCDKYLNDYGRFVDHRLELDNNPKVILIIALNGEESKIQVKLTEIKVIKEAGEYYLQIGRIEVNREWMQRLGQDYLNGKFVDPRIELTRQSGLLLSKVF
jgi:hypothetical protein